MNRLRIEHVALFAEDVEALKDFYVEALGLTVVVDNSRAPVRGYFLSDGAGCALELIDRPAAVPAVNTRHVCHVAFVVENYDEARRELEGRGVEFEAGTAVESEPMRTSFFNDPAGNRCQVVWRKSPLLDA